MERPQGLPAAKRAPTSDRAITRDTLRSIYSCALFFMVEYAWVLAAHPLLQLLLITVTFLHPPAENFRAE